MRKLVSVRKINDITQIKNADAIETVHIDGWTCVAKKGEFQTGDKCVYFEIDSFLPEEDERFAFLMKNSRTFEDKVGFRVRTIKLRGQLSQGLALPITLFPEIDPLDEGDVADKIGVVKWEPQIPACLGGQVKGVFPGFIRKTDEERAQNLVDEIFENEDNAKAEFEVSIKLDGTSCTAYHFDGVTGVCSRNLELKVNEENKNNSMVKVANESGLLEVLAGCGRNVAVQGEIMGPGIQGNREKLKNHQLFVFNVFDIDRGAYMGPEERQTFFNEFLAELDLINHVPVLGRMTVAEVAEHGDKGGRLENLLKFAEGPSLVNTVREGLVWKRIDGGFSFKTISNKFLLKGGD